MSRKARHLSLIRGAHNLRAEHRGCVATIGNFDGVHRGHQQVIASVQSAAAERQLPTVVISFEPLPREYFAPQKTPPRLTRWREKVEVFDQLGVDRFLCLPFNEALAGQAPGDFIQQVLVDGLGVKHLVVGDDFRFGRDRAGDFATLQQAGERFGFAVVDTKTVMEDKARISSTRIRQHLERGELDEAAELLGRSYSMSGRVAHGDKRGRIMGYPTANIHIHRQQTPVSGIFVVRMHGLSEGPVDGVASLGVRPTFYGDGTAVLEVHLFDFDRAIYGEHVRVEFLHKIRDEEKFDSMDALIEKMDDDARRARAWFASAR